jgi:alpha-tubulin suppressor-like RCC1 family protein
VPDGLSNVVAIAAGGLYSLALKADGTVTAWGCMGCGVADVPAGLSNVVAIAAGDHHSLALKANGMITAWGENYSGETDVPAGLTRVVAIAAGGHHSLALKADGTIIGWGNNSNGQTTVPAGLSNVVAIVAGGGFSLAVKPILITITNTTTTLAISSQSLLAGSPLTLTATVTPASASGAVAFHEGGTNGQVWGTVTLTNGVAALTLTNLGIRYHSFTAVYGGDGLYYAPSASAPEGVTVVSVSSAMTLPMMPGASRTLFRGMAVPNGAATICWFRWGVVGDDYPCTTAGQDAGSGFQSVCATTRISAPIPGLQYHYQLVASNRFGVIYGPEQRGGLGNIAAWGGFYKGPVVLSNVVAIAAGESHSLALKEDGIVTAWGDNFYGQTNVPVGLRNVVAVAAGWYHSLALKEDGTVTAWGATSVGLTNVLVGWTNVVAVAAGTSHDLALKADGDVMAWGANDHGQTTVPAGLSKVVAIAAVSAYSLALKANGAVIPWGALTPVWGTTMVPVGLSNAIAIAGGGGDHSLALKADGTVAAWGENLSGQTTVPVGLSNVVAIVGGGHFSLALTVPIAPSNTQGPQLIQLLSLQFPGDGSARLQFGGRTNALSAGHYVVLNTDDLKPPVQWRTNLPVGTVTNGVLEVIDATAGGTKRRFYRLQQ